MEVVSDSITHPPSLIWPDHLNIMRRPLSSDIASVSGQNECEIFYLNLPLSNREGEIRSALVVFDQEKPQPVCLLAVCNEAMMQRLYLPITNE